MSESPRKDARRAVSLLVALNHADRSSFEERFATNVSPGGMFVRTRNPAPVGTRVHFDVQIADKVSVMRGEAVVRWRREQGDERGPPGMGLEFIEMDEATREVLSRMLERQPSRQEDSDTTADDVPEAQQAPPPLPPPRAGAAGDAVSQASAEMPSTPVPAPAAPAALANEEPPIDIPIAELFEVAPGAEMPMDLSAHFSSSEPAFELDIEVDVPPELAKQLIADRPVFLTEPESIPRDGPIIGIDLGTSNSCVAIIENGKPVIVPTRSGGATLPSVISLAQSGKLLVGIRAHEQLMLNPGRTIYGAKRLVGRAYDSPVVQEIREHFHYAIRPDSMGRAAVQLGDHVLTLEEVQGLILRECREIAEERLKRSVHRAVITVPAYYSEPQRDAVRRGARLAGLHVERVLNEPTAAALAYGLQRGLSRKVLVYDLGGGTLDATLLRIDGDVFEVLATGGDVFLGGVDFDNAIVDVLIAQFEKQSQQALPANDATIARIRDAAERAKISLSEQTSVDIHLPMLMMDAAGKPHDLRCTLTRAEVERVCEPLVSRTLDVVRDVLLDAEMKTRDVDEVILVGGQSRMPMVREQLRVLFGRSPHAGVNPDEAVALGAALYSGTVDRVSSLVLIDVLPMTIGIGLPGGGFKRVLERNSSLPAHRTFTVPTTKDGQRAMEFSLFQGEAAHVAENEYLGTVRIDGLPQAQRGMVKVAVTVRVDAECVVHVEAREVSTRRRIQATMATRYTPEELRKKLPIHPRPPNAQETRRAGELRDRAGQFWNRLRTALGGDAGEG